jgi:hypothetical protein
MYIVIDTLLMVKNRNGTSVHKFTEIKANTLQKQTRVHMPHLKKKKKIGVARATPLVKMGVAGPPKGPTPNFSFLLTMWGRLNIPQRL